MTTKAYYFMVRLDYRPAPDETEEFAHGWLESCIARSCKGYVDTGGPISGFSVDAKFPDFPRVSDWPGGFSPEGSKSSRHWLIRKSVFGRWTPLHLVVELVKFVLYVFIARMVLKSYGC